MECAQRRRHGGSNGGNPHHQSGHESTHQPEKVTLGRFCQGGGESSLFLSLNSTKGRSLNCYEATDVTEMKFLNRFEAQPQGSRKINQDQEVSGDFT